MVVLTGEAPVQHQCAVDLLHDPPLGLRDEAFALVSRVAADDFDTGYSLGFRIGRAVEPHTWELGYTYERIEKDAMFGQFVDSDFGGGLADRKGHAFRGSYAPGPNWILSGTYYLNKRFIGLGPERDYERMQVDLNYRL